MHCRKIYFSFRLDMGLVGFRLQGWGLDHLVSQRCQGIVSSAWLLCRPGRIVGEVVGLIRSLVCIPGPGFNFEHFETGCAPTNFKVFKVGVAAWTGACNFENVEIDGGPTKFKVFKVGGAGPSCIRRDFVPLRKDSMRGLWGPSVPCRLGHGGPPGGQTELRPRKPVRGRTLSYS